jgi:hypothetical protein
VKGKDGEGLKENGNISFHLEGEIENERWGIDRNGRQSQREKKISLREKRGRGGTGNERREISVLARGLCLMLERKSERDREKERERKRPENWRRHRDRGGGLNWNGTTSFRREELFERRASLVSLEQYNCLERGLWSVMERVTMRKEKDRDRKREQEKERARWEWERQTKRPQRIENGTTSLWSGDSFLWAREKKTENQGTELHNSLSLIDWRRTHWKSTQHCFEQKESWWELCFVSASEMRDKETWENWIRQCRDSTELKQNHLKGEKRKRQIRPNFTILSGLAEDRNRAFFCRKREGNYCLPSFRKWDWRRTDRALFWAEKESWWELCFVWER